MSTSIQKAERIRVAALHADTVEVGGVALPTALTGVTASAAELNILDGVTATAAELNALDGATPIVAVERTFTETTGAGTYTGTVAVPAGATVLNIVILGVALWTATSSATLVVGDGSTADAHYTAKNLKSGGDLAAGDALNTVTAIYSASARSVVGVITTVGAAGDAGRTRMVVVYALPLATAAATKA